ncbi:MAG: hypothetical protein KKH94_06515 [Candidatus Omnitrophica bacterium]|nr:hypothetical protein [Candidatus Omnitrophota bacterium]
MKKFLPLILFFIIFTSAFASVSLKYSYYSDYPYQEVSLFGPPEINHYMVFIMHYTNDGQSKKDITDSYTIVAGNRQYEPVTALLLKSEIEKRKNIKDNPFWIGEIYPGVTKEKIVVFEQLPADVQEFTLHIETGYGSSAYSIEFKKEGEMWKAK